TLPELRKTSFSKKHKIVVLIFLTFICSLLIYRSFTPLLSNYYFSKAMEKNAKGEYGQMTILLDYSQELPNNRAWQSFYAQKYGKAISSIYPNGELVTDFFLEKELQDADNYLYGNNFRNISSKIIVESSLENSTSTEEYVNLLINVSSNLPESNMIAGNYYSNIKEYEKAIEYYNKALANLPDVDNKNLNLDHLQVVRNNYYKTYLSIANNYFKMLEYDKAIDNYKKAYSYNPIDYLVFKKIADIYFIEEDYQKVIPEVKKGMRLSPEDYTWPILLHYTYEKLNNSEMSEFWLEKAMSLGYEKNN
ncbi:MAG: tetratricopeptide repeat protein, partial [Patescibacteria group bacterium]|nr:tetratricopeptide repeat protein [Patescibacteria group bacterium]